MSGDQLLTELAELLLDEDIEPVDPTTFSSFDTVQSVNQFLDELAEEKQFEASENIVNADILKFIDNPKYPTASERMSMLDKVGNSAWYDHWETERARQVSALEGLDNEVELVRVSMQTKPMTDAKQLVQKAFDKIEMSEITRNEKFDAFNKFAEETKVELTEKMKNSYNVVHDATPMQLDRIPTPDFLEENAIEMQEITSTEIVESFSNLEDSFSGMNDMGYYAIDENSNPISARSLEMLDEDFVRPSAPGWDMFPTVEEFLNMGLVEATSAALVGFTLYGLVEGLTPIIDTLTHAEFIQPPWKRKQQEETMLQLNNEMDYMLGPEWRLVQAINKFLKKTPIYIWYHDSPRARIPGSTNPTVYGPSISWGGIKHTLCTNMWLRGRVVAMAGKKVGFMNTKEDFVLGVSITLKQIDIDSALKQDTCYWVNAANALIVRDNATSTYAANTINLSKLLFSDLKSNPFALNTKKKLTKVGNAADMAMFNSLMGNLQTIPEEPIKPKKTTKQFNQQRKLLGDDDESEEEHACDCENHEFDQSGKRRKLMQAIECCITKPPPKLEPAPDPDPVGKFASPPSTKHQAIPTPMHEETSGEHTPEVKRRVSLAPDLVNELSNKMDTAEKPEEIDETVENVKQNLNTLDQNVLKQMLSDSIDGKDDTAHSSPEYNLVDKISIRQKTKWLREIESKTEARLIFPPEEPQKPQEPQNSSSNEIFLLIGASVVAIILLRSM